MTLSSKTRSQHQTNSLRLLAGGVAHDFNNLLMAILGNADLALNELSPNSPVHTSISEIHSVALRAADLCQQMLIYSGGGDFTLRIMELNHLANALVPLLESIVPLNAKILHDFSSQPLFINADFTRIQQVILNLVTNAAEALADEDGTISLETGVRFFPAQELLQCVAADPPAAGRFVFLNISDSGRGIDQQTLSRIFDPFFSQNSPDRGWAFR